MESLKEENSYSGLDNKLLAEIGKQREDLIRNVVCGPLNIDAFRLYLAGLVSLSSLSLQETYWSNRSQRLDMSFYIKIC